MQSLTYCCFLGYMKDTDLPPGSNRTPIACHRGVVVQRVTGGRSLSSRALVALPKNQIVSLSRAGSLAMPVLEPLLFH
jgi:hypothetical protein